MIKTLTKKIIALTFIAALPFSHAFSQYTLQSSNLPGAGVTWGNQLIADPNIQPGTGGSGVIWDFNIYNVTVNTLNDEYRAPLTSGVDATFPTANIKAASYFGWTDYYYINAAKTELQYLGFQNSSDEVRISNTQKLMTVPFTYGNSITNVTLSGTGYLGSNLTGTISIVADGYGTLKVGGSTYNNVTRVKYDYDMVEDYGGGSTNNVHVVKYAWYRSGKNAPQMQISTLEVSGINGSSSQKYATVNYLVTGVDDINKPSLNFSAYPNPVKDQVSVMINLDRTSDITLKLMDITGKIRFSETTKQNVGDHILKFDVSDLPKGIYILSAIAGTVNRQQRIIIAE